MVFKQEVWVDNTLQWTAKAQLISLHQQDLVLLKLSSPENYTKDLLNYMQLKTLIIQVIQAILV